MRSLIISLLGLLLVGCANLPENKALEERVSNLEKALAPFLEGQSRLKAVKYHKSKARQRMRADRSLYSQKELKEIEELYQVANRKWRSEERKKSLEKLISKFTNANRTGCATLYLGQMSKGDKKISYLKRAIKKFSDCYYGDGVQVGAYARFKLLWIYVRNGDKAKAENLIQEIKTNYPDAIDHRGNSLVAIINREFEKNK